MQKNDFLKINEAAKIVAKVPDFLERVVFSAIDLQQYDPDIFKKLADPFKYNRRLDVTLYTAVGYYGGELVRIYESIDNGHYVFWRYTWGD